MPWFIMISLQVLLGWSSPSLAAEPLCESYREYLTAYNYLLDKKSIIFTKDQASQTAFKVAQGCNGAAGRFIRVFDLLINARITIQQSSEIALEIARSDENSAETFAEIFKSAYLEKNLDLSIFNALHLARTLSQNQAGGSRRARNDYSKTAEYCLNKLSLPKPDCAKLAFEIAQMGDESSEKSVSDAYMEMMDFLRNDKDGPKLATFDAMAVAKDIIAVSADAGRNFIPGYKFARDKDQLALNRVQAIAFAKSLALMGRAQAPTSQASETK